MTLKKSEHLTFLRKVLGWLKNAQKIIFPEGKQTQPRQVQHARQSQDLLSRFQAH